MQLRDHMQIGKTKAETRPGPLQLRNTSPGIHCEIRCGRCQGGSYTDEEGDLVCISCGRLIMLTYGTAHVTPGDVAQVQLHFQGGA